MNKRLFYISPSFLTTTGESASCDLSQLARLTVSNVGMCDLDKDKMAAQLKEVLANVLEIKEEDVQVVFFGEGSIVVIISMPRKAAGKLVEIWEQSPGTVQEKLQPIFGANSTIQSISVEYGSTEWPFFGR